MNGTTSERAVVGVDVGGSGIKGALVDPSTGSLLSERLRLPTPSPSTPERVATTLAHLVEALGGRGPIGCTFPAIVRNGVTLSAANVDQAWIGAPAQEIFEEVTGRPVVLLNDGDAAGVAEMAFGAGVGRLGTVLVTTFGTGIGSALFTGGQLLPNAELGHLIVMGHEAEAYASDRVRKDLDLSYKKWGKRVGTVLRRFEFLFSPDLIVIGGGASKKFERFAPSLGDLSCEVVPAHLKNDAGIVGAAYAAAHREAGGVRIVRRSDDQPAVT